MNNLARHGSAIPVLGMQDGYSSFENIGNYHSTHGTDEFFASRRAVEWEPSSDPRCHQFRPAADTSWLLGNCFKIIMMQAGFAVVESSFVRQRNSANIMMKNVVDLCMGALGFWAVGWALAYGVDPKNPDNVNGFCGTGEFFLIEGYDYAMWMVSIACSSACAYACIRMKYV